MPSTKAFFKKVSHNLKTRFRRTSNHDSARDGALVPATYPLTLLETTLVMQVNELEVARQVLRTQVNGLEAERLTHQESRVLSQTTIETLAKAVDALAQTVENLQTHWEELYEINRQNTALHAQSLAMARDGIVRAQTQRAHVEDWEILAADLMDSVNGAGPAPQI